MRAVRDLDRQPRWDGHPGGKDQVGGGCPQEAMQSLEERELASDCFSLNPSCITQRVTSVSPAGKWG